MAEAQYNADYLLDSDREPLRLERQALIYGFDDDLRHLSLSPADHVLDAGCGSGSITREIARSVPNGSAIGIDREPKYIDFARRKAAAQGIANIGFEVGNVTSLPFEKGRFDVVWSKHLLQWVKDRDQAIREFVRVTRPGGRVIACNFGFFCMVHYPVDTHLQSELEIWFEASNRELGTDTLLGRKLPHMFIQAGLKDVAVDFIPDRA